MAAHEIKLKIQKGIEVLNTDITVVVKKDGKRFGTITVSRGTIDWRPTKKWVGRKNEIQMNWTKFDKVMRENQ
jgi:putative transposon-encoded protein